MSKKIIRLTEGQLRNIIAEAAQGWHTDEARVIKASILTVMQKHETEEGMSASEIRRLKPELARLEAKSGYSILDGLEALERLGEVEFLHYRAPGGSIYVLTDKGKNWRPWTKPGITPKY